MARKKFSDLLHIRLDGALHQAIRERALVAGMSVPELARDALRRAVGWIAGEAVDYEHASAQELVRRVVSGDLCASRVLVNRQLNMAEDCISAGMTSRACELLTGAVTFGQFAVALGTLSDERVLAYVYLLRAKLARDAGEDRDADELQTFAIAALDQLADEGEPLSAVVMAAAEGTTPQVFTAARELRASTLGGAS